MIESDRSGLFLKQLLLTDCEAPVVESAEQLLCLVREWGRVCKRRYSSVNVKKDYVVEKRRGCTSGEINNKIKEVASSFEYFGSCFSEHGFPQNEVIVSMAKKMKTFGALKMCQECNVG